MHHSVRVLSFAVGQKLKSMTETTVRNEKQQHCLGGEYLIRDYSWQFFPQQKAQEHENKERMMAGGPIKQYVSMSKT